MALRSVPFDGKAVVDSWGALEFDAVTKRLGMIGAGGRNTGATLT